MRIYSAGVAVVANVCRIDLDRLLPGIDNVDVVDERVKRVCGIARHAWDPLTQSCTRTIDDDPRDLTSPN
jgi:hypothetical protein